MKPILLLTGAVLAVCLMPSLRAVENPTDRVGDLGDLEQVEFRGNQSVTNTDLWAALRYTPEWSLVTHPSAPLAEYLATLEKRLLSGYRHSGFPDAQVKAGYDKDLERVVIQIKEGPRFKCGAVKVTGAKGISAEVISKRLGEESKTGKKTWEVDSNFNFSMNEDTSGEAPEAVVHVGALWIKDRAAHFSPLALRWQYEGVTNLFKDAGYYRPQFTVRPVRDDKTGLADLLVDITAEGPKSTLGEIVIEGNQKNSRAAILRYLDLKPGQPIPPALVFKTWQRLWNSARFLKHEVSLGDADDTGKTALVIALQEFPEAPALDTDLTPAQKVLLKTWDWLKTWNQRDEDLVISMEGDDSLSNPFAPGFSEQRAFQIILSPRHGLLAVGGQGLSDPKSMRLAFFAAKDQFAYCLPGRQVKYALKQGAPVQLRTYLHLMPVDKPEEKNYFNFSMGAGFQTTNEDRAPGVRFEAKLAPAAFLSLANKLGTNYVIQNGTLAGTNRTANLPVSEADALCIRLDAATGKLLLLTDYESEAQTNKMTVKFVPHAFVDKVKEIAEVTAGHRNYCDTNRPLSAAAQFLAVQMLQQDIFATNLFPNLNPGQRQRLTRLADKIMAADPFSPLWPETAEADKPAGDEDLGFIIPDLWESGDSQLQQGLMAMIGDVLQKHTGKIFTPHTWPWTLVRNAGFVLSSQTKYVEQDLKELLESEETGPLGCYVTARLLLLVDSSAASHFALRGMEKLETADFRRDYRALFAGKSGLAQSFERLADGLRSLTAEEIEALAAAQDAKGAALTRHAIKLLQENKGKPAIDVLAPVLDQLWETQWRPAMLRALTRLSVRALVPEVK